MAKAPKRTMPVQGGKEERLKVCKGVLYEAVLARMRALSYASM